MAYAVQHYPLAASCGRLRSCCETCQRLDGAVFVVGAAKQQQPLAQRRKLGGLRLQLRWDRAQRREDERERVRWRSGTTQSEAADYRTPRVADE